MAILVWSKRNIFQLSAKIYVTYLYRKCGDYEIMQAPHISHILRRNRRFMGRNGGVFEKMRPPHQCVDLSWLCVDLCDRIIAFFWRDWLRNTCHYRQSLISCPPDMLNTLFPNQDIVIMNMGKIPAEHLPTSCTKELLITPFLKLTMNMV